MKSNGYPLKLKPAFQDYIWGGTRLKNEFHMQSELDRLAEAWVLSCHKDGHSIVENGAFAGLTLAGALQRMGSDALGENGRKFTKFPVLIKLIDAVQNLSIQVHPDDAYALEHEHEYGKTEMWYVIDCEEGAGLYYGFHHAIDKEEFKRRIENDTLLEVLNRVEVKKGDCFLIKSGTIHAIGAGLLIAEIQQNSNTTYRVYDFGRLGVDGKPRQLHIEKALDVTCLAPPDEPVVNAADTARLAKCGYFTVDCLNISESACVAANLESFAALLVTEGSGELRFEEESLPFDKGDCFFLPAGMGNAEITGKCRVLKCTV